MVGVGRTRRGAVTEARAVTSRDQFYWPLEKKTLKETEKKSPTSGLDPKLEGPEKEKAGLRGEAGRRRGAGRGRAVRICGTV